MLPGGGSIARKSLEQDRILQVRDRVWPYAVTSTDGTVLESDAMRDVVATQTLGTAVRYDAEHALSTEAAYYARAHYWCPVWRYDNARH